MQLLIPGDLAWSELYFTGSVLSLDVCLGRDPTESMELVMQRNRWSFSSVFQQHHESIHGKRDLLWRAD